MLICALCPTWEKLAQAPFCSSLPGLGARKAVSKPCSCWAGCCWSLFYCRTNWLCVCQWYLGHSKSQEPAEIQQIPLMPAWQPQNIFHCLITRHKTSPVFLFCSLVVAGELGTKARAPYPGGGKTGLPPDWGHSCSQTVSYPEIGWNQICKKCPLNSCGYNEFLH